MHIPFGGAMKLTGLFVSMISCYASSLVVVYFTSTKQPGVGYIHQPKAAKDEGGNQFVGAVPMQRFCWAAQRRS